MEKQNDSHLCCSLSEVMKLNIPNALQTQQHLLTKSSSSQGQNSQTQP